MSQAASAASLTGQEPRAEGEVGGTSFSASHRLQAALGECETLEIEVISTSPPTVSYDSAPYAL
jgi:hypothetical protein